jgi:lipoate-protein ligase A
MGWRLLPYAIGNPAWNMAADEAIFQTYLEGGVPPTLRFFGWDPATLSVGYFQDLEREIRLDRLCNLGYGLVRRTTGGRAVLHDRELTYTVVAGVRDGLPDGLRDSYLYISKALAAAFQTCGITVSLHATGAPRHARSGACFEAPSWYELTVDSRKLVGSAQYRKAGSFLQHGSILLDFSGAKLASLLKTAATGPALEEELERKVISFAGLGQAIAPEELAGIIAAAFTNLYRIEFQIGTLSPAERELAGRLMKQKYANPEWTYRRGANELRDAFPGGRG